MIVAVVNIVVGFDYCQLKSNWHFLGTVLLLLFILLLMLLLLLWPCLLLLATFYLVEVNKC